MRLLAMTLVCLLSASGATRLADAQDSGADNSVDSGLTAYVEGFNSLLSGGDLDPWLEMWAENVVRILPSSRQKGLGEIREAYEGLVRAYSRMHLTEKSRRISGNDGTVECQFEGVLRANGNRISQPVTLRLRFGADGKLERLRAEFNEEDFLNQMRAQQV